MLRLGHVILLREEFLIISIRRRLCTKMHKKRPHTAASTKERNLYLLDLPRPGAWFRF
jgi:hypothetical protein